MKEPRWLTTSIVSAVHADQIATHGGATGLRDPGLLDSAPERPRNRFHYEPSSDLYAVAAAYGFAIVRNHPFVDGNKRVAFQCMYVFLGLNGVRLEAPEEEVVSLTVALAGGDADEADLATWLRARGSPR